MSNSQTPFDRKFQKRVFDPWANRHGSGSAAETPATLCDAVSLFGWADLLAGCHLIDIKLVGFEQLVQFGSQVESMAWTLGETGSAIFGCLITQEAMHSLEIDGPTLIAHTEDGLHAQHLFTDVGLAVGVSEYYLGFWSAHVILLGLNLHYLRPNPL